MIIRDTHLIKEGEVLIQVPSGAFLQPPTLKTSSKQEPSPVESYLQEKKPPLSNWMSLVLLLMHEMGNSSSPWTPYLKTLPKSFTTPLHWKQEELDELRVIMSLYNF
jgi:hypothetical protein